MSRMNLGSDENEEDDDQSTSNMENFVKSIMNQMVEQMMGDDDPSVMINSGYLYEHHQPYVSITMNQPQVILSPRQAIDIAWAILGNAFRSQSDGIWFDILRNHLSDEMGNLRPFSEEDAEIVRKLLRQHYAELDEEDEEAGAEEDQGSEQVDGGEPQDGF